MNQTNFSQRSSRLQEHIPHDAAWLLSRPEDIKYYSGFDCLVSTEREAFLVMTSTQVLLIHAAFSPTTTVFPQVKKREGAFITQLKGHLHSLHETSPFTTLAIDSENMHQSEYAYLEKDATYTLANFSRSEINTQRSQKDNSELSSIQKAIEITTQLHEWARSNCAVGMTEKELTRQLYARMIELGGDITPAFPFIVAFGPHTALPHHQPTTLSLTENTPVLIDIGARFNHYCADMTRSFWFGDSPDSTFTRIESVVMQAYAAAEKAVMEFIEAGTATTAKDVDDIARAVITDAKYEEYFIHTTGHGLGLDIHEPPSLSWRNPQPLQPNMALTIEPGIYLPEVFGFRHENTLLLTPKRAKKSE